MKVAPRSLLVAVSALLITLAISLMAQLDTGNTHQLPSSKEKQGSGPELIIPPPLKDLSKDHKVRLVYFVPKDREAKANYREKSEVLMRVVADIYRREMQTHKHETRGLDFEFEEDGRLKVHLIKAKHPAVFYTGDPFDIDHLLNSQQQEIWEATGFSRNRPTLVFSEAGAVAEARPIPHIYSGLACVSGDIFRDEITASTIEEQIHHFMNSTEVRKVAGTEKQSRSREAQTSNGVLIHELGHIFGMLHDTRDFRNIMMRGYDDLGKMFNAKSAGQRPVRFSAAHARMASVTRFFSEAYDKKDMKPPEINAFKLSKSAKAGVKTIDLSINMHDERGLGPMIIMQRGGGQIDAFVKDLDLKGKNKYSGTLTVKSPRPLVAGQPLIYIINVFDINGNLSQQVINARVEENP